MAPIVKPGKSGRSTASYAPLGVRHHCGGRGSLARDTLPCRGAGLPKGPLPVRRTSRSLPPAVLVDAEGHVPFVDARRRMAFAFRCRSQTASGRSTAPIAA